MILIKDKGGTERLNGLDLLVFIFFLNVVTEELCYMLMVVICFMVVYGCYIFSVMQ